MQIKRIIILLLVLLSIKANAQMVNRFRDSTWFAKGVQFDSTINFKGLKVGTENDTFIMVCRADGNIYKVDKSNFIKNIEYLPLAGGTMYEGATINFPNGSKLSKGTINANLGGNNGIAFKCSIDYEMKWEAGRLYIMQQDGATIRQSLYNFNIVPTVNDDNLKGYTTGSLWTLDNGDTYECTDPTTASAVWVQKIVIYQTALYDSITAVRNIRKVDTLYKNLDSILFTINGLQYSISDSVGTTDSTVFATKDYVNGLNGSNATKTELKDSIAVVRGLIPDVTGYATKTALKDTSAILRGLINAKASTTALSDTASTLRNIRKVDSTYQSINSGRDSMVFVRVINGTTYRSALRDSINPLPTFTFVKNSAKDSIIATYNGTRSAVKDSTGGGGVSLSAITAATATNSIANKSFLQTWNWANSSASKGGLSLIISDTTTTEGTTGIPTTTPLFVKRTGTITTGNYSYAAAFINESTSNLQQRGAYFRSAVTGSTTAGPSVVAENSVHIVKNTGIANGLYFGTINDYTGDASIIRSFNVAQLTVKSPASGTIYLYPQSTAGLYIQSSTSEILNFAIHTSTKSALGFGADYGSATTYRAQTTTAAVIERSADALKFSANSALSGGYAGFTPTFQLNIVGSTNNVGIGTTTPVTTAKLEIVSTTQGFLPPRMTTTQILAIASPAEGLIVYNTTLHELCFYDSTGWHKFSHSNM